MSETSQGPGWWQASDHRWYPPDLRPDESVPAKRPRGSRKARGPGWWQASDRRWYAPDLVPGDGEGEPLREGGVPAGQRAHAGRWTVGHRISAAGLFVVVVAVALIVSILVTQPGTSRPAPASAPVSSSPAVASAGGWIDDELFALGPPVLSDGHVLSIAVGPSRKPLLYALDPSDGRVVWSTPYSVSDLNAAASLPPLVEGATVLDLAPEAGPEDPAVQIKGIDAATGRTIWSIPSPALVLDPPALCTDGNLFCIEELTPAGTTALALVQPSNGDVTASVAGTYSTVAHDLYEEPGADQVLVQLGVHGAASWSVPVDSLFGGPQYSATAGADFTVTGSLYVGTVGVGLEGAAIPLEDYRTIGVRVGNGSVAWRVAGAYQCLGALGLEAPFACRYETEGRLVQGSLSVPAGSLTLEGLDEHDGSVSWSVHVRGAELLTEGEGVIVAGSEEIVVQEEGGPVVVLDLVDGATSPVPGGARFWCEHQHNTAMTAAPAALFDGVRRAAPVYSPCNADGSPGGAPSDTSPSVGVVAGGMFVWPSPGGMRALPLSH